MFASANSISLLMKEQERTKHYGILSLKLISPERTHSVNIANLEPLDIAPCGVNCRACSAWLNVQNPCPGCRAPEGSITRKSCKNCAMKKCAFEKKLSWCFECECFPCSKIKDLSKRYQKYYHVNLIENGINARENMGLFIEKQIERFTCRYCGGTIDQHNRRCSICANDECL